MTTPTDADIRWATPADVPELERLINLAFRVEDYFVDGNRTNRDDVAELLARSDAGFMVLEGTAPGQLCGSIYVAIEGQRGYFGMLSIDPTLQGQGLGKILIGAAESHARSAGCTVMEITVVDLRVELPPYYARFGYAFSGATEPFPDPDKLSRPAHLVVMRKSLTPA